MRRLVALILFLTLLFSFQSARAQGTPSLSSVNVSIWPEYDQPSVLVIYHIIVSSTTSLPATMTFRIPADAEKPAVVAVGETLATVSDRNIRYSLEPDGKWVKVNIEVTGPAIQLEYYDASLTKEGQSREYFYTWPGDYAVQSFNIELQQPYDASDMQVDPQLPDTSARNNLTYYSGSFGPFEANTNYRLNISYQKKSDSLSIAFMPVDSPNVDTDTLGRVSLVTYLPWIIAGIGVLLITGGVYYYLRGQPRVKSSSRRRHAASAEPAEGGGTRYCPQCGTRARTGDRFCRTCGTRIRPGDEE